MVDAPSTTLRDKKRVIKKAQLPDKGDARQSYSSYQGSPVQLPEMRCSGGLLLLVVFDARSAGSVAPLQRHSAHISCQLNRKQRRHHLQPAGTPLPPAAGEATALRRASLAGVTEDHAYEQFFWDQPTRRALLSLASQYHRPLMLCCPSLAVDAGKSLTLVF